MTQYHYLAWPDGGVPASTASFLQFLQTIHSHQNFSRHNEPVIFHCSAGCGRTGTGILTSSMLQMADNEKHLDFLAQLCHMRKQRVDTVEEIDQYVFAHRVLAEFVSPNKNGFKQVPDKTYEIPNAKLNAYVEEMKLSNGLKTQFEGVPLGQTSNWTVGKLPANASKNRYSTSAAYDQSRVELKTDDAKNAQTDYINACYIHGYKTPMRYIACQAPIPSTVNDMWRLIWQSNSSMIIMLTKLVDGGKVND